MNVIDDKPQSKLRSEMFLKPLTREEKRRKILIYDVESKDGDSQEAGFSRPFLVGFDHGDAPGEFFTPFRNTKSVAHLPWQERHLAPGGCVDQFCTFVFGMDFGSKARTKFQSNTHWIGGHNAGRFDCLFIVPWLLDHRGDFCFELVTAASRVQILDVWPRGMSKKNNSWRFIDTISLIPLSLKKLGQTFAPKEISAFDASEPGAVTLVVYCAQCGHREDQHLGAEVAEKNGCSRRCIHEVALGDAEPLIHSPVVSCRCETFISGKTESKYEKMKFDLNTHEDDPSWEVYNAQDCLVARLGADRFATLVQSIGGELGITGPATSMNLFRRRFLDDRNWIRRNAHFAHCNEICSRIGCDMKLCGGACHGCLHDFVRDGYYGGRTEPWRMWGRRLKYYDINSSYPASMLFEMPVGEVIPQLGLMTVERARKLAKNGQHVGFVWAKVFIPKGCKVPPLPHRHPKTGKLVFPVGTFSGVWDWAELECILDKSVGGKILEFKKSVWFAARPIFRDMVSTLYAYREKHRDTCEDGKCRGCNPDYDDGLAFVAKLLLNSLYGKFGQREERSALVMVDAGEMPEGMTPLYGDPLRDPIWEVDRLCSAAYVVPQISAHITALSRIRLWKAMTWIVEHGGKIFYVDTDSIMTDIDLDEKFVHPSRLGAWKLEDPGALLDGEFILPKLYRLRAHEIDCLDMDCQGCKKEFHKIGCNGKDDKCGGCTTEKHKMKGLPHRFQTPENWAIMATASQKLAQNVPLGDEDEVQFSRLSMMRSMLRTNEKERVTGPSLDKTHRGIRTQYDKRIMRPDGSTLPIELNEAS